MVILLEMFRKLRSKNTFSQNSVQLYKQMLPGLIFQQDKWLYFIPFPVRAGRMQKPSGIVA